VVRLPKTNIKEGPNSRYVSVDMFGIQYTDFLSEHLKPTPGSTSRGVQAPLTLRPLQKTLAEETRASRKLSKYAAHQKEHWCSCHGIDDGREMMSCANKKCLIGWFHMTCVLDGNAEVDDDSKGWICTLCSAADPSTYGSLIQQEGVKEIVHALFVPDYVKDLTGRPYGLGDSQEGRQAQHASLSMQDIPTTEGFAMQLDGSSDPPDMTSQPLQISPQRQFTKIDPNSLLASKHAPPPEELAPYLAVQAPHRSPTPSIEELPETPGGPYTPGSTTSEGEWRSPPIRFQYLASFIQPGSSLDRTEKAAVEVWKAASKEQLHWQRHLETAQQLRECFAGLMNEDDFLAPICKKTVDEVSDLEDGEVDETMATSATKPAEIRGVDDDGDEVEINTGGANVSISECRGKDLSTVVAEARSRVGESR